MNKITFEPPTSFSSEADYALYIFFLNRYVLKDIEKEKEIRKTILHYVKSFFGLI